MLQRGHGPGAHATTYITTPRTPTITTPRHYLDNAATSWPKPPAVYEAVMQQMQAVGAAAGRGAYHDAVTSADVVQQTRAAIARLISAPSASCIAMAANGTAALNLAIQGIWPTPPPVAAHVVTTAAEHNSVLRPLQAMADRGGVELQTVPCDASGTVRAEQVLAAVRDDTQLVAVGHASNVTAAVQPIAAIGEALVDHPALLLCDAAQTFGYLPIDVQAWHVDLLASPGHKGGLGPLGTGFLYAAPHVQPRLTPSLWGGTGGNSDLLTMPDAFPQRLEAGNLNVPAIAGWLAGLRWLEQQPDPSQHLRVLSRRLDQGLEDLPGVRCLGVGHPLPLRSFVVAGLTPSDVGAILDAEFGVQVRTGLHCAALIHHSLDTQGEGTVRISAGHLTNEDDVAAALDAVARIAAEIHS